MTHSLAQHRLFVLVRGIGDIASAVAHALFGAGHRPLLHVSDPPTTARRRMAFADAFYDGAATLEGVGARRHDTMAEALAALGGPSIPVCTAGFGEAMGAFPWDAVVDARMRKHQTPERLRGAAPLTIGLGPGFTARGNVDLAIETSWDDLGAIVRDGPTLPLRDGPRSILGYGRERYIYAPRDGLFTTDREIGAPAACGDIVAMLDGEPLRAPLSGTIRGLTRSGIVISQGSKVVEMDPRTEGVALAGIVERPRRIAAGVLKALDRGRI